MKHYSVEFREYSAGAVQTECILANNKADAYQKFMDSKGWTVYSAWVSSVTYQNGNCKWFNTFEGNPY